MHTINLKIRNKFDLGDMPERYSFMFRKMFANSEMLYDKGFEAEMRERFGFDSWIYNCVKGEVELKLAQIKTDNSNKKKLLKELQKELKNFDKVELEKKGKKWRRHKFKVIKKITYLLQSIDRNITFGGRSRLQRITHLHNKMHNSRKQKERENYARAIEKLTGEYHEKRILPFTVIGEAPHNSNRKFDFDFTNKKVTFKPSKGIKIPIEFYASDGHMKVLEKLQHNIGGIAITVRLNGDSIQIIYDEEKLNGFAFNERECKREYSTVKAHSEKAEYALIKRKWHKEQERRMLVDKVQTRYISVDLNPENIGYCVFDKKGSEQKIIDKGVMVLDALNIALNVASTHKSKIHQRNKRDHEIKEVWSRIFKIAEHYKVANFVIEDLEFKTKSVNDAPKQANRKVKNLWHKELTLKLIDKHCHQKGIKKIPVNCAYSTFIGNIKHEFCDPLNAAIEIGRRGFMQFEKGGFYPEFESRDVDTMCRIFGLDVQRETLSTWVEAFSAFKTAKLIYRRDLQQCKFVEQNLLSHKSLVKSLHFYTN